MFKDVFISHAKEDSKAAEQLYDFLLQNGYSPWLDKKKLKAGTNWDYEIKKALRECTFVILLLSSTSVKKRGYIQKEFKYALEYWESKLVDDIYIIPVLLDKCEIPDQLSKFQWTTLSNQNFREEIIDSLNSQRQKYLSSLPPDLIQLNEYTVISIDLNVDIKKKIDYTCELPLFYENTFFDAQFVNTFIQQKALQIISSLRSWILEIKDFIESSDMTYHADIHHVVHYISKKFLSISIVADSFIAGAHPNTTIDTLNFQFAPARRIFLHDVVEFNNLSEFLLNCITKYGIDEQRESLPHYVEYMAYETVNFHFDETVLCLDFTNHLPRVIMALGDILIPLTDLKLKIQL